MSDEPVKRKRGRPPKNPAAVEGAVDAGAKGPADKKARTDNPGSGGGDTTATKKTTPAASNKPAPLGPDGQPLPRRGRGRPPKTRTPEELAALEAKRVAKEKGELRGRGRPRKVKDVGGDGVPAGEK